MRRALPFVLMLLCIAALCAGVLHLFKLRYDIGDVYPPYSSLRADPLGTMALYESLDRLGLRVRRDYSTDNRLPETERVTYLHLAGTPREFRRIPASLADEIERFVRGGGRLAITFRPRSVNTFQFGNWEDDPPTNGVPRHRPDDAEGGDSLQEQEEDAPAGRPRRMRRREDAASRVRLAERWGIDFDMRALEKDDESVYEPVLVQRQGDLALPEQLEWHSGIVISNSSAWKTIYLRGRHPVVVERQWGRGSIVFATDSYFVSNEAMHEERHADLLAWFIGPAREVVFDEAHLGVTEQPGMATLLRKYRLHWVAGALIALAGLFIWKNAFSLLPAHEEERRRDYVVGKHASAGFVNLLRRSIPTREVLATGFAEWKRTAGGNRRYSAARLAEADRIFEEEHAQPAARRDPVRAYHRIKAALEKHRRADAGTKLGTHDAAAGKDGTLNPHEH
ncbi:MAG TPA: DUF4350 domain-containing protein [Verrucomicrobiae bacterium]|nr:DUF4350 domain-containing protein [Verrucomicrobiae bacterium]